MKTSIRAALLSCFLVCPTPLLHAADAPPAASANANANASGAPGEPSREAMFQRLSALAATGNADVLYNLGMFYNNGIGTQRDNPAAFRLFLRAAQAGNPLAAYKVGCYYAGQFPGVVPADPQAALDYKLRAADAGYDLAQHDVALHFARQGKKADASMWWEKASRQGDAASTSYLAYALSEPDSTEKVKGLALMRVLQAQMPSVSGELSAPMAAIQAALSPDDEREARRIEASWLTGPTPLTRAARTGLAAVPGLLRALDR